MKTSRPQLALACAVLATTALCLSSCHKENAREVLRIKIARHPSHLAVGQSAHLRAFQEYRLRAGGDSSGVASAGPPLRDVRREPVTARWSISDSTLATLGEDGTLQAIKPGRLTIKGAWDAYEATANVEVLSNLQPGYLPQLTASVETCKPQSVELSLNEDRSFRFDLSFEEDGCADVRVEAFAPAGQLPWEFPFDGGRLRILSARGPIVSGTARINGRGEVAFTAWSEGAGAYPVSFAGQRVLLVGDSMAEGLAPSLQRKVEGAGGRFFAEPWESSTIIGWEGTHRLKEMIERHQPDVVFVSLGSNELEAREPAQRAPLIRRMVAEIGERRAFWIGPPSWKPDKGLLRVIEENFQPGHFYNSSNLLVPRQRDGKHPTLAGFEQWTELIWSWYARAL